MRNREYHSPFAFRSEEIDHSEVAVPDGLGGSGDNVGGLNRRVSEGVRDLEDVPESLIDVVKLQLKNGD
jgi:hypothetical protein